jgi:hypothetical protein
MAHRCVLPLDLRPKMEYNAHQINRPDTQSTACRRTVIHHIFYTRRPPSRGSGGSALCLPHCRRKQSANNSKLKTQHSKLKTQNSKLKTRFRHLTPIRRVHGRHGPPRLHREGNPGGMRMAGGFHPACASPSPALSRWSREGAPRRDAYARWLSPGPRIPAPSPFRCNRGGLCLP